MHAQLRHLTQELLAAQQARHLAEGKLRCSNDALQRAQALADTLAASSADMRKRAVQMLRQQRDQAVQTANRLRLRLAATQVAATQHARLAAQHAGRAEVRRTCVWLVAACSTGATLFRHVQISAMTS
jgi:hypothetical protein